jgi:hypothetical protein
MANYILKTVKADGSSYDNFMWPLKVGATVIAPDFNNNPVCGGGLHGLYNGIGNGRLLNWRSDAVWIVAKVPKKARVVDLGNKVKVDRCKVVHVGNQETATKFLVDNGCDGAIVGLTATAGYEGTATVGDYGTATVGDYGTATVGDYGTATAGYEGTATAGNYGTATAGNLGTATAGYEGTATAGNWGTATAGYEGTATAGYEGTATVGDWGTATVGDYGTATAGYEGTATVGDGGTIILKWWDGSNRRQRIVVGYVGEKGIESNVAYQLDRNGKFVKADKGENNG